MNCLCTSSLRIVLKSAKVLKSVHLLTRVVRLALIMLCSPKPKTFAFDFGNPYWDEVQDYLVAKTVQMSLRLCTVYVNQDASQVWPLRQNQEISDSNNCHREAVWSTRKRWREY